MIDDLLLPPGETLLHCECGYESPAFCFCDHVYGCASCGLIVFPEPLPFVYAPPKCNQCDRQLTPQNRILASRMTADDREWCPHCDSHSLKLRSFQIQLLSSDVGDAIPDAGQLLHARTRQPELECEPFFFWSPRLLMNLALAVSIANHDRNTIPNGHHEFRTVSAADDILVVNYVRELSRNEWRWYIG